MAQKRSGFLSLAGLLFFVVFIAAGLIINNRSLPLSYNIAFGNTGGSGSGGGGGGGGGGDGGYGGTSAPLITSFKAGCATASEVQLNWTGSNFHKAIISYTTGANTVYTKLAEFDGYLTSYTHKGVNKDTRYKYKLELINTIFTTTAESIIETLPSQCMVGVATALMPIQLITPLEITDLACKVSIKNEYQPSLSAPVKNVVTKKLFILPTFLGRWDGCSFGNNPAKKEDVITLQKILIEKMGQFSTGAVLKLANTKTLGCYGDITAAAVKETQIFLAQQNAGVCGDVLGKVLPILGYGVWGEATKYGFQEYFSQINQSLPPLLIKPTLTPTQTSQIKKVPLPPMQQGNKGPEVIKLQELLIQLNLGPTARELAAVGATGRYLIMTMNAVIELQGTLQQGTGPAAQRLAAILETVGPGIYGPATAAALEEYLAR